MTKSLVLAALTALLIFSGCKKDSDNTPASDTSPSAIVIDAPTSSTLYINGSTMNVTGTIVDNDNLSQARVEIKNKISGAIYNQQSSTTGTVSFYRFQWSWPVTGITGPTQATVKITAKDKNGFEISKSVDVNLDN